MSNGIVLLESTGPHEKPVPWWTPFEGVLAAASDPVVLSGAAGVGAVAAAVVATVNLRIDHVARRSARVSSLVAHFMSPEVTAARDLVTGREHRRHTADSRHAAFILLWSIERVGADLDALRPSLATSASYLLGRRPRQASGVEVLYANMARVTRSLNRYFRSDATNSYFEGSVRTANDVLAALPDWNRVGGTSFKTKILSALPAKEPWPRHIYLIEPPVDSFVPPRGTGGADRLQVVFQKRRMRQIAKQRRN